MNKIFVYTFFLSVLLSFGVFSSCGIPFQNRLLPSRVYPTTTSKMISRTPLKQLEIKSKIKIENIIAQIKKESELWFTWLLRVGFIGAIIFAIPIKGVVYKEKMVILVVITATLIIRDGSTVTSQSFENGVTNAGNSIGTGIGAIGTGIGVYGLFYFLAEIYKNRRTN